MSFYGWKLYLCDIWQTLNPPIDNVTDIQSGVKPVNITCFIYLFNLLQLMYPYELYIAVTACLFECYHSAADIDCWTVASVFVLLPDGR